MKIIELLTKCIDLITLFLEQDLRPLIREFREYLREKREKLLASQHLPEHLTLQEVADYLNIDRSSVYRNVVPYLLKPCKKIGRRSYFKKNDVIKLMEEYPDQGKGNHRFKKRH